VWCTLSRCTRLRLRHHAHQSGSCRREPFLCRAVQHECIPQAILGMDVLCQAKSGMGKTAVFVLSVLQQIEPATPAEVAAIVLCHTRELAYQVSKGS